VARVDAAKVRYNFGTIEVVDRASFSSINNANKVLGRIQSPTQVVEGCLINYTFGDFSYYQTLIGLRGFHTCVLSRSSRYTRYN
jgi:hypothetical protein